VLRWFVPAIAQCTDAYRCCRYHRVFCPFVVLCSLLSKVQSYVLGWSICWEVSDYCLHRHFWVMFWEVG
jgi:hypothetical protein